MDAELITELMNQLEHSTLSELELQQGGDHLLLKKAAPASVPTPQATVPTVENATVAAPEYTPVRAPLVGVVYLTPEPEAPQYKQVGDHVEVGDVLCIIESMKMMNEIHSEIAGTVRAIEVASETLVEFDQILLTIEED
jgi:acetyl-CoA carboxylase biotin carboxyl carrier protein